MKTTKKKLKRLIVESIIKYSSPDGVTMAHNASGVFSRESLEQQFQNFYDESIQYQKTIIGNPDGNFDRLIDELGQANAAAKLYRYIESLLAAKYGTSAAIIFNLSDFPERSEKQILDFPSIEKAIKRAIGYDITNVLFSGNTRDFPDTETLSAKEPREVGGEVHDLKITPIEGSDDSQYKFGSFPFSFDDDDESTIPRHEYEPTQSRKPRFEPTAVLSRK